jgi:NAD(P)-dependent dehydrogenase (short-subunit alcohol dehydrogenase family)
MLERKRGKIVVVGSADSLRGRSGGVALYGGARAAQHGYMRHVAMEVAPHVNVNATAQSYVENPTYEAAASLRSQRSSVDPGSRGPSSGTIAPLSGPTATGKCR